MKMNKKAVAGLGLGALALVGGSFAYYNQTATLDNPLKTGHYENEVVEDYTPPTDEVKPGATIDKKVGARNTGDYPVVVRIRMDEKWHGLNANDILSEIPTDITAQSSNYYLSSFNIQNEEDGMWKAIQADDTDGLTEGDQTVVRKNLAEGSEDKWLYNQRDGYWYYYKVLERDEATEIDLLDSLSIASNIDLGHYENKDWYFIGDENTVKEEIAEESWIPYEVIRREFLVEVNGELEPKNIMVGFSFISKDADGNEVKETYVATKPQDGQRAGDLNKDGMVDAIDMTIALKNKGLLKDGQKLFRRNESKLDENKKGYADANYTLTITSQFVQATPDAVKEAFTDAENAAKYDDYWFDMVFANYDLNANSEATTEVPAETTAPVEP